jgi:3-hydroxy acid dehydrogenase / malonic semialdehyde reductase
MIALITGATSGIGEACAEKFAANGYDLILTGRRSDRLDDLKKKFKVDVLLLNFDVRNRDEVVKAVSSLEGKWKNIDVLVNNAGLALGLSTLQDGDIDDWDTMIDTNVKGLLYMTKAISGLMIPRNSGHIINIGSIAGKEVYPKGNVYCATKHAVDALNKAMRLDLLPHNIRVSEVCPGMVETEFSLVRYKGDAERATKVYEGIDALQPGDIANIVYWMASQPPHVNIAEVVVTPTAQGNATNTIRKA